MLPAKERPGVTWSPLVVAFDIVRHFGDVAWQRKYYRAALKILERERPDAIYERYERGSRVGDRLARKLAIPLLVEVNTSLTFMEEWRHEHSPLYPMWARAVERDKFSVADGLLPVSPALSRYMQRLGVGRSKIAVISAGADPSRYSGKEFQARDLRLRNGLDGKTVIGYVGSFKPWIDLDLLLDSAVRIIDCRQRKVHFVLIGDGEQRQHIEARIAAAGVRDNFTLTGLIPPDEVPAWLMATDIAVAPYLPLDNSHFTPMKVLEYMAAGRALVASRAESTERIVVHGENGLLVSPGDVGALTTAVLQLEGNPERRRRLGASARRTVEERFSWHRQVELIDNRLERVVEEREGRR